MRTHINPPVFIISSGLILLFVFAGVAFTETFETVTKLVNDFINLNFGWLLTLSVTIFLIFAVFLMFSKYGKIRLSQDDSGPAYSYFSWLAMLFSAGMGIGLLFYGVAEPLIHYSSPPGTMVNGVDAAKTAMDYSFLHWGLHAWATYIVLGLSIAYFTYRKGYPLSFRYIFYPVMGNRIYGTFGHVVDILAIIGTLFGVATSLGLGAMQINTGLNFLTGLEFSTTVQIILIAVITMMAMTSVVSGVNKGIKWLSILNICGAALLLLFVIGLGPTVFIIKTFIQNTGHFFQNFIELATWNASWEGMEWQNSWSIFYWSWWIAWAPYVGMFIARISKGRTIREFIAGVLLVPSLISFLWLTAFGSTSILFDMQGKSGILAAVQGNISTALFEFLNQYPFALIASGFATLIIVTFFVTSSDSGSLVVDMIASGGDPNPPIVQRVFWSILEGVVAATLLIGGGLIALQTATLTMALPFSLVMLLICYSLYKGLRDEAKAKV